MLKLPSVHMHVHTHVGTHKRAGTSVGSGLLSSLDMVVLGTKPVENPCLRRCKAESTIAASLFHHDNIQVYAWEAKPAPNGILSSPIYLNVPFVLFIYIYNYFFYSAPVSVMCFSDRTLGLGNVFCV